MLLCTRAFAAAVAALLLLSAGFTVEAADTHSGTGDCSTSVHGDFRICAERIILDASTVEDRAGVIANGRRRLESALEFKKRCEFELPAVECKSGINNVDNTRDLYKPLSFAAAGALDSLARDLPNLLDLHVSTVLGGVDGNVACDPGTKGPLCGEDIDECADDADEENAVKCKNGGLCLNLRPGYMCTNCNEGWGGKDCSEDAPDCAEDTCSGHGACYEAGLATGKTLCKCLPFYSGATCNTAACLKCKPNEAVVGCVPGSGADANTGFCQAKETCGNTLQNCPKGWAPNPLAKRRACAGLECELLVVDKEKCCTTDAYFLFDTTLRTFDQSKQICEAQGMAMAKPATRQHNELLAFTLAKGGVSTKGAWVARYEKVKSIWYYADSTPVTGPQDLWAKRYPKYTKSTANACAYISTRSKVWYDTTNCKMALYTVCQPNQS